MILMNGKKTGWKYLVFFYKVPMIIFRRKVKLFNGIKKRKYQKLKSRKSKKIRIMKVQRKVRLFNRNNKKKKK